MQDLENLKSEIKPDARREWDADADLRAEFDNSFDRYLAYTVATIAGRVRVIGGVTASGDSNNA